MTEANDDGILDIFIDNILLEAIEDEIIGLVEEVIIEDDERDTYEAEIQIYLQNSVAPDLSNDILDETLLEESFVLVGECFDEIYTNHRNNLNAIGRLNEILQQTIKQLTEEVVLEVLEKKTVKSHCQEVSNSILGEVLAEEFNSVSFESLNHYGARIALLQYKQMQATASGFILDKVLLNSLLLQHSDVDTSDNSKPDISLLTHEKDAILNEIVLDILLSQSSALHACFPNNMPSGVKSNVPQSGKRPSDCVPLNWYKKKMTSAIAEDVALTMLCDRLDESMQIAAEEQIKEKAVSLLVDQYLSSDGV